MKSIIALPNDYVVVDLETTGTNPQQDDIIEISAIRYRNGVETESFDQLISVGRPLGWFISSLTGITDEMLQGKPCIEEVIQPFSDFVGDDILIGHNIAAFDTCFLSRIYSQYLGRDLENACVDTLRLSKKIMPDCSQHSLEAISSHYGVSYAGAHRGGNDCRITHCCYQKMRAEILSDSTEEEFCKRFAKKTSSQKFKEITTDSSNFDDKHPLYQKVIVFTGTLSMTRNEAAQMAADVGAILKTSVTTKTAYLVVGCQDIDRVGTDGMSSKEEKAYALNASGKANIQIISESDYVKLVNNEK